MNDEFDKISLHGETHAIEVANLVIRFRIPLDGADMRRLDDKKDQVQELYPALSKPDGLQIAIGNGPAIFPPDIITPRQMTLFGRDGKPEWSGMFGGNNIVISCHKYSTWEDVWPEAKRRIDTLLDCVDPFKPVQSIEFSVTDTFSAKTAEEVLTPSKLFKENEFIPSFLLNYNDPRWDFSQGWFETKDDREDTLIRLDGRGAIRNDLTVVSINNTHANRVDISKTAGDLRKAEEEKTEVDDVFSEFHDMNKDFLRRILVNQLLERMGLIKEVQQ